LEFIVQIKTAHKEVLINPLTLVKCKSCDVCASCRFSSIISSYPPWPPLLNSVLLLRILGPDPAEVVKAHEAAVLVAHELGEGNFVIGGPDDDDPK
jgi:hypothetical protein